VLCFIDTPDVNLAVDEIEFVEAAWLLRETPIGGQRLVKELQEKRSVDAVMSDQNDDSRIRRMSFDHRSDGVGGPGNEILKRVTTWKSHEMRRRKPLPEKRGPCALHLGIGLPLPGTVIEVIQVFQNLDIDLAGGSDMARGRDAATHRARIHDIRTPGPRDTPRDGGRLSLAERRQG